MASINFKSNFHIEILDFEQVVIFSEDQHHLLQGPIYVDISKMLCKCPVSEGDIVERLSQKFPIEHILEAVNRLKKKVLSPNIAIRYQKILRHSGPN